MKNVEARHFQCFGTTGCISIRASQRTNSSWFESSSKCEDWYLCGRSDLNHRLPSRIRRLPLSVVATSYRRTETHLQSLSLLLNSKPFLLQVCPPSVTGIVRYRLLFRLRNSTCVPFQTRDRSSVLISLLPKRHACCVPGSEHTLWWTITYLFVSVLKAPQHRPLHQDSIVETQQAWLLDYEWAEGAAHRQLKCHSANHSTARHTLTEFDSVIAGANEETKFGRLHWNEKDQASYWNQSHPGGLMRADRFEQQTNSTHASSWCLIPFGATSSQARDTASIYLKT